MKFSGGYAGLVDSSGNIISPATALNVARAIDSTSYDLNAGAYSEDTNIVVDYILDSIELNFSTAEAKTITITSADGTLLWGGALDITANNRGYNTTARNFNLIFNQAFNAGDNITIEVTQTSGACLMDCILKTRK